MTTPALKRTNVIELNVRRRRGSCFWPVHVALATARTSRPFDQHVRISNGGGKPDSLDLTPGQAGYVLKHRQQVPTAIIPGKSMNLIDDDYPQITEQIAGIDVWRNEHDLKRLWRRQQTIRRIAENLLLRSCLDVAVPQGGGCPQGAVPL